MTNELEKQFFQCFGIEPREFKYDIGIWNNELNCCEEQIVTIPYIYYNNYSRCPSRDKGFIYPQITDRILLKLICIDFNENPYKCRGGQTSVDEVKERILSDFIHEFENDLYLDKENIKHQVHTLFEEG